MGIFVVYHFEYVRTYQPVRIDCRVYQNRVMDVLFIVVVVAVCLFVIVAVVFVLPIADVIYYYYYYFLSFFSLFFFFFSILNGAHLSLSVDARLTHEASAVVPVCVFVQRDTVACAVALACNHGAPCQEDIPQTPPPHAILGLNRVLIFLPVFPPLLNGCTVVYAHSVNVRHLKSGSFDLVNNPAQRAGGIGTGENVAAHKETPDEIFPLPGAAQTGDLEVKQAVIGQHALDLGQKGGETADTDVLGHLQAADFVICLGRNVAVVTAQHACLVLRQPLAAVDLLGPLDLIAGNGHARGARTAMFAIKGGQRAPSAANIKHTLTWLELKLIGNHAHLVVLHFFKSLRIGAR